VLLFKNLDSSMQRKIVENMWERTVPAGEILIQEGETGVAASELYVVKEGKFEVRAAPHGHMGTPHGRMGFGGAWLHAGCRGVVQRAARCTRHLAVGTERR
jgi:hypothetical protein